MKAKAKRVEENAIQKKWCYLSLKTNTLSDYSIKKRAKQGNPPTTKNGKPLSKKKGARSDTENTKIRVTTTKKGETPDQNKKAVMHKFRRG